ncbi:hypothetical protein ACN42_g6818, partial [Penicillium freii]
MQKKKMGRDDQVG